MTQYEYERDGAAIYRQSFATIRAEADLGRFTAEEAVVAVRLIHACGMVEIADEIVFHPEFVGSAKRALRNGEAIFCDSQMVASGITRSRLPAANDVICTLASPHVIDLAKRLHTTRSAAAMELWGPRLKGALVVIGNAPTALFRFLEMLEAGTARPAAVIGIPVGFVGAVESKQALIAHSAVPYLVVKGRRGGSAMAASAVNALSGDVE